MAPTQASRRDIFRTIAQTMHSEWPAYDSTPLYDRSSLDGLEADIQTVVSAWFDHEHHESVEEFVCTYPLSYVDFQPHDRYSGPTRYEVSQLFRVFLLKRTSRLDPRNCPCRVSPPVPVTVSGIRI